MVFSNTSKMINIILINLCHRLWWWGRDGSWNVGLSIVVPPDVTASPRMFYRVLCQFHLPPRVTVCVPHVHSDVIFLSPRYPKYILPKMFPHQHFTHFMTVRTWFTYLACFVIINYIKKNNVNHLRCIAEDRRLWKDEWSGDLLNAFDFFLCQ
jgi:hypothetical protein